MRTDLQDSKLFFGLLAVFVIIICFFSGNIITKFSLQLAIVFFLILLIITLTLVKMEVGLTVMIFSMLLSPEIIIGQVPGRDIVIRFDDLLLAVITFSWLAKTALNKRLSLFKKTPLNIPFAVYLLICLFSTLRGAVFGHVDFAKGLFYVVRYSQYFLLYLLVVNYVQNRKQIKFFLTCFFITCASVSVYGILQIPQGVRVSAPFEGEVGEPNTFGGYLLFILCIAIGIFLQNISPKLKFALLSLATLIIFPFLYSLSRASYMAIIFSFLVFIIASRKRLALVTAMSMIIFLGMLLKPESVLSRVKSTFRSEQSNLASVGDVYLDRSASERIFMFQNSVESWTKNPVLGRGITGSGFIDGQYVRTLPELGIIGLLAFLWLLWTIFKQSLKVYNEVDDELYKGLSLGFLAGFIGLTIHALTTNTFLILRIMEPFWFVAGMVMLLPKLREIHEEREIQQGSINNVAMLRAQQAIRK